MNQNSPYFYQSYPKWIKSGDGKDIIVQNNNEHRTVLGEAYVHNPEWGSIQSSNIKLPIDNDLSCSDDLEKFAKIHGLLECDIPDSIPVGIIGEPIYIDKDPLATDLIKITDAVIPSSKPLTYEAIVVDDKETLLKQADALGVYYDKRWGTEKLKAAIAEIMNA